MPLTSPPGYDNGLALRLAGACRLAYGIFTNPNAAAPPGYQVNATFSANLFGATEVFGYLMSSVADAVVAFRGTVSGPDWLADGSFAEVDYPYVPGAGLTHQGFTLVYQSCREQVLGALQALPPQRPLFIAGHSLGAAIATLAALDVAVNSPFKAPILYTFGGPRVGDPTFADAFDATVVTSPASSWRVLNTFDIVPLLPPEQIYDGLEERYFHYRHVDKWFPLAFLKGGVADNHALVNYIAALGGG